MALNTFGGYGTDPFSMMDPLFFDSAWFAQLVSRGVMNVAC